MGLLRLTEEGNWVTRQGLNQVCVLLTSRPWWLVRPLLVTIQICMSFPPLLVNTKKRKLS